MISEDLDHFYGALEMKYWSKLNTDAISEKNAVSSCFKELRASKERSINLYLSSTSPRENLQHKIAALHPLACSEICFWRQAIDRRMHIKAKHSNPWLIEFNSRLQNDIFLHIKCMLTCVSMFGVSLSEADVKGATKKYIVQITDARKLKQFFSGVCGNCDGRTGFKKDVKAKGPCCQ